MKLKEGIGKKAQTVTEKIFSVLVVILGIGVFIYGMGIVVYQVYQYLKTGAWIEMPLMIAADFFEIPWIDNPTSWYGFHKIVVWVLELCTLSIAMIFLGSIIISGGLNIGIKEDSWSRTHKA